MSTALDEAASVLPRAEVPFTLCDTASKLLDAVKMLTHVGGPLILDCEGHNLGSIGGQLSLIQIGNQAANPFHVYIVDVCALQHDELQPLFAILESNNIVKILYDARMDYSALYHEYDVTLTNVVDLTLADVASRTGGEEDRLKRLYGFIPKFVVDRKPMTYAGVLKLNSVTESVKEHNVAVPIKGKVDHTKWLERPLQPIQLQYSAMDLNMICQLSLELQGPISLVSNEATEVFISLWKEGPPDDEDPYARHPLLPCGIMPLKVAQRGAERRECEKCLRLFHQFEFSKEDWKKAANHNRAKGSAQCRVCRTVSNVPKWLTKKRMTKKGLKAADPGSLEQAAIQSPVQGSTSQ